MTENTKSSVLFQKGAYRVECAGVEYAIVNVQSEVVEETTSFLFEAIRLSKIYDKLLEEALTFEPKGPFTNEPKLKLPTQLN